MVYIGDYFAIGLVAVLFMFYFEGKVSRAYLAPASKIFVVCLLLTAATAGTDLMTVHLMSAAGTPLWLNMAMNSIYFIVNIITTSCIALFLFIKILEHAHDDHCMKKACCGLITLFSIYILLIAANIFNGWLFSFDESGNYCRGPFNAVGYIVTVCQMILVLICYFRNRRNADQAMRRVLWQIFPVAVLCILIQRKYPEIMLNGFLMAMADTVLFLTFQGQRQGIHNLTKLNDRHRFFRDVERRISRREKFQVFIINIKDFGTINQKYGHLFGDEFLYQFAFSLEKLLKNSMAFHMNGTVFALTLPFTSQSASEENCSRLLAFLEEGVDCVNEQIHIDYVLVEYLVDENDSDAAEFYEKLEYASSIAYGQKQRYIRYSPSIGDRMRRERYLIDRLRNIDREHGYRVWYQPIKCLENGLFCSMEALLRLYEPDGSMISPAEFIPLAEQTGNINSITWFVLDETCKFLAENPQLDYVSVSVNLPMTQLLDRGFFARLDSIVGSHGIDRGRICLEFTERAILDNFRRTKDIMDEITSKGYRFYLDDFGTGYSNFSCLIQLPFHSIKLDASMVPRDESELSKFSLVDTLLKLFHDMELSVIAEGVETIENVHTLGEMGVDRIQGFALARPMPPEALLEFYNKQ